MIPALPNSSIATATSARRESGTVYRSAAAYLALRGEELRVDHMEDGILGGNQQSVNVG